MLSQFELESKGQVIVTNKSQRPWGQKHASPKKI